MTDNTQARGSKRYKKCRLLFLLSESSFLIISNTKFKIE